MLRTFVYNKATANSATIIIALVLDLNDAVFVTVSVLEILSRALEYLLIG